MRVGVKNSLIVSSASQDNTVTSERKVGGISGSKLCSNQAVELDASVRWSELSTNIITVGELHSCEGHIQTTESHLI